MREILFRGKRVDNGEWVEGCGIIATENWVSIFTVIDDIDENSSEVNEIEVLPETVGQFTGLFDKNGKKIFEGNIVRYDVNYHDMVISYDVENWGGWLYEDMDDNMQAYSIYEFCLKDIAVVGNIHDNPELLKGGTE